MKRMVAEQAKHTAADPSWDRVIDMVKNLSVDQRLKLADNIKASAIADIKAHQEKLQAELGNIASLLGGTAAENNTPQPQQRGRPARLPEGATTSDKVLAALRRGGNKTVKDLQAECGTPWVNSALSQLIQGRQIVSDGKRPAGYSLR